MVPTPVHQRNFAMTCGRYLPALCLAALLCLPALGDPGKDEPARPAAEPAPPDTLKFHMMDGSVITGKMAAKEIVVQTPYGTLKIPVADVRSFRPGLQSHPDMQSRIDGLFERLGSADQTERDAAQRDLTQMGPTLRGELLAHLKDADPERKSRLQTILDQTDDSADDDADSGAGAAAATTPTWTREDAVETRDFTVAGAIAAPKFDLVSVYGPLTVNLGDIRFAQRDAVNAREEQRKSIEVEATCMAPNSLKATSLHLEKGDTVIITASGQVTMTPWGGNAVVGPDGGANYQWYLPGKIPGGALVGKIGKDGEVFKVGSKYTFKAEHAGVLSLGVGIPLEYAGQGFPGQYSVKIVIRPHP